MEFLFEAIENARKISESTITTSDCLVGISLFHLGYLLERHAKELGKE